MTKKKPRHSKNLKLDGPVPDFVAKLAISKGIPVPLGWAQSGKWDHLLNKMDHGDSVAMEHKVAASFINRCRNLGYVVVARKENDENTRVWFEGLNPKVK